MLKHRILTGGLFLTGVALLYAFAPAWLLALVIAGLALTALGETLQLVFAAGLPALNRSCFLLSLLWLGLVWYQASCGAACASVLVPLMPVLLLWVLGLGSLFSSGEASPLLKLGGSLLALLYIPAQMQFLIRLLYSGQGGADGRALLLYGILVIKCTDIGAYFTGNAIGKRKLIPSVSPGKTWEGVLGGVAAATLVSVGLMTLYGYELGGVAFERMDAWILGPLLAVSGIIGDLLESMLKRAAKAKDSGSWLKGMGGMLDVLDSLILGLPVLFIYLWIRGGGW